MRLALIRQRYTPYGGAERFLARTLQALKEHDVEVTVLAREWDTRGAEAGRSAPAGAGAAQPQLLRCAPFYAGRLWRDWSFARAVCRAVAQHRFDLVQSHERIACCDIYRAGDGVHAQWLDARRRVLGAWARLGLRLSPYHAYTLAAERRLFASAGLRAVICNSKLVASEIAHRFRVPERMLHVIYSGVDLDAFHPRLRDEHRQAMRERLGIAEFDMVYLLVGSGFERKGVPKLLEAFARLRARAAHLVVVGADRRSAAARRRAEAMGLGGQVIFAGPQTDVRPWYGAADCFVLPTLYDPLPNAALEAMASGLPVITSRSCGAAELIVEGKNGYVCDALDVVALAERMAGLDTAAARAMGERARDSVAGLGLAEMAGRLLELYASLMRPAA